VTVRRDSNEAWGTRIGLILAMAGNAVGLGNFLRFPVQAATNGGGSFMITYFIALLLLGLPLMWIEWGVGRNGGRYRKGHIPGMFAAIWKHPAAKYLGVVGMVIPLVIMIYYTYIESWTLAFMLFSLFGDYWGRATQPEMVEYLQSFQGIGDPAARVHAAWTPYLFFIVTLVVNRRSGARREHRHPRCRGVFRRHRRHGRGAVRVVQPWLCHDAGRVSAASRGSVARRVLVWPALPRRHHFVGRDADAHPRLLP